MACNVRLRSCHSWMSTNGAPNIEGPFGPASRIWTNCCSLRYGIGRSRTWSTTVNIATLAPIPAANIPTARIENPGARRSCRKDCRMSPGRELRSKRHLAVSEIVAHTEIQSSGLSPVIKIGDLYTLGGPRGSSVSLFLQLRPAFPKRESAPILHRSFLDFTSPPIHSVVYSFFL